MPFMTTDPKRNERARLALNTFTGEMQSLNESSRKTAVALKAFSDKMKLRRKVSGWNLGHMKRSKQ